MGRFAKVLTAMTVACAVVALVVVTGALAGDGGNSIAAKACQKGGWASPNLQDGTGQPLGITFSSEEECVAFGARGGDVFNPSLVGDPSHVGPGEESFWIAAMLLAILFHGGVEDARTITNLVVFQIRMVKPPITMRVPPISVRKDGRSRKISAATIWEIRKNATM